MAKLQFLLLAIVLALISLVVDAKIPGAARFAAKKAISLKAEPKQQTPPKAVAHGSISTPSPVDPFCKEFNSKCAAKCFSSSVAHRHEATLEFKCKPKATHYYDFGCVCDDKDITAEVLKSVANPPKDTTTVMSTTTTVQSTATVLTSSVTVTDTTVISGSTTTFTTLVPTLLTKFSTTTQTITVPSLTVSTVLSVSVPTITSVSTILTPVVTTVTSSVTTTTVVHLSQAYVSKYALVQVKPQPAAPGHANLAAASPAMSFCAAYKESCTETCGSVKVSSEICSYVNHYEQETYRLSCRCRDHTDRTFEAIDNIGQYGRHVSVTAVSTATETVTSTSTTLIPTTTTYMTTSDVTVTSAISLTYTTTYPTTSTTVTSTPTTSTTSTTTTAPTTTTTSTTSTTVVSTATGFTTITVTLPTGVIGVMDVTSGQSSGFVSNNVNSNNFYTLNTDINQALRVAFKKMANGLYGLVDVSSIVGNYYGAELSNLGNTFSSTSAVYAYLASETGDSPNGGHAYSTQVEVGIWGYNLANAGLYPVWTNPDSTKFYATVCNVATVNNWLDICGNPALFAATYSSTPASTYNLTFVAV